MTATHPGEARETKAEPDQPSELGVREHVAVGWARADYVGIFFMLAACVAVIVLSEIYSITHYRNVVDDAQISMQYAKNLVLGNGLVFNVGERVEGYTNFSWTVLLAPIYAVTNAIGAPFIETSIHVNIAIAALDLALVYALGRRFWGSNRAATLLALGLCVVDNSYTVWAALGLEGHLLAFWLLSALLLASSRGRQRGLWLGLVMAAAHMTRPDAGLFNAFIVAGVAAPWIWARFKPLPARMDGESLRVAASALGTWLCVYGAYFAWRYHYYGWLLPNTYYVKIGAGEFDGWERGFKYVRSFLAERWWLPSLALFGLFAPTTSVARAMIFYLLAHTLYVAYIGGDFFPGHRFFVAQIPLFGVACGLAIHAASHWLPRGAIRGRLGAQPALRRLGGALASLALLLVLWGLYRLGREVGPLQGEIHAVRDGVQSNREFMRWLSFNKPAGASIATCAIGTAGFDGEFARVVDVFGIIDPEVAHQPARNFGQGKPGHEKSASLDHILGQRPTYIQYEHVRANLWDYGYYFDAGMRLELQKRVEGIWHRDELAETGQFLPETAMHFEASEAARWTAFGSAFEHWPSARRPPNQNPGAGEAGSHVNSFDEAFGDLPTGRLLSAPFDLVGDLMVSRVGGGFDPQRLVVSLLVDGQRVFFETGFDSENLSRRTWPIAPYKGKRARLEIVDDSSGQTGHILVDEVIQWRRTK
jgi:arabinofuranosyltransferase